MSPAIVVTLLITLILPDVDEPITHSERMGSLTECWEEAIHLAAKAEEGPLKDGGRFRIGCQVDAPPTQDH